MPGSTLARRSAASRGRGGDRARVGRRGGCRDTAATKCLADDLDALVVHLRYPTTHRRRWRSTNLLERSLAEVKRRTKVIGRFPGETSCLTLVRAVLALYITDAKNGVRFSQFERQRLRKIRDTGSEPTPAFAPPALAQVVRLEGNACPVSSSDVDPSAVCRCRGRKSLAGLHLAAATRGALRAGGGVTLRAARARAAGRRSGRAP
jgi:Transposase, Mutator family